MSKRRKPQHRRRHTEVETWDLSTGIPGLDLDAPPAADPMLERVVHATELEAISSAVHRTASGVWEPVVILRLKGRVNGSEDIEEMVLAIPAAEAAQFGESVVATADAANSDAMAEALKAELGWNGP